MTRRLVFSALERDEIRALLRAKHYADRDEQKRIRRRLRDNLGFHISDWSSDAMGFTVADFDSLLASGQVTIDMPSSPISSDIDVSILRDDSDDPVIDAEPSAPDLVEGLTPFTRGWLEHRGWRGFVSFEQLRREGYSNIPRTGGVYVVLRDGDAEAEFLDASLGGHFKRRDPTVAREVLLAKWVEGAACLYIGKANHLQRRLREFARYGAGEPVGHQGGRYIWQLAGSSELGVSWMETSGEVPRAVEVALLAEFAVTYGGRKPFANIAS